MTPLTLAIITAASYGLYNFFIKLSSGHIHQIVGAVILQVVAALLGLGILLYLYLKGEAFLVTQKGIQNAIWGGDFRRPSWDCLLLHVCKRHARVYRHSVDCWWLCTVWIFTWITSAQRSNHCLSRCRSSNDDCRGVFDFKVINLQYSDNTAHSRWALLFLLGNW